MAHSVTGARVIFLYICPTIALKVLSMPQSAAVVASLAWCVAGTARRWAASKPPQGMGSSFGVGGVSSTPSTVPVSQMQQSHGDTWNEVSNQRAEVEKLNVLVAVSLCSS